VTYTTKTVSILMIIFLGRPGLAGTSLPFWILLELTVMEIVVITGAVRCGKLQSSRHHQQTCTQLFTDWMPFLLTSQQCQSTERVKGTTKRTEKIVNVSFEM